MLSTVKARIDLGAVHANLRVVHDLCPRSRVMAIVKADAYGHGLIAVARALRSADGLAVARLHEALALRDAGVRQRVLLLSTHLDKQDLAVCSAREIDVTLHDRTSFEVISQQAHRSPVRVWLKLDSGMHRLGLDPHAFLEADKFLSKHPGVLERIHMSHFSCADQAVAETIESQLSCFCRCSREGSGVASSLANSAALISRADTHREWVRPGIMLYGVNPVGLRYPLPLRPAMALTARVISVREVNRGESVGYNQRWTSLRRSRIGTIGVGYGDGYPRHARNGTPIWIKGAQVSLVGQVSMDSLSVDLTEREDVQVGDEAVLWGPELSAAVVAEYADTIAYELFTSVQSRVPREYLNGP